MPQTLQRLTPEIIFLQFIKLLTGNTGVKIGDTLESETSRIKVVRFLDRLSGRKVTIVDTPGFDDSRAGVSDTDTLRTITNFLLDEWVYASNFRIAFIILTLTLKI